MFCSEFQVLRLVKLQFKHSAINFQGESIFRVSRDSSTLLQPNCLALPGSLRWLRRNEAKQKMKDLLQNHSLINGNTVLYGSEVKERVKGKGREGKGKPR